MDGSKEEVAPLIQQLLQDKAALLQECFAIQVTSEGLLAGLPQLIEGHCPDLGRLPHFVLHLARDVDWENEKECFRGVAQVREAQQKMTLCCDYVLHNKASISTNYCSDNMRLDVTGKPCALQLFLHEECFRNDFSVDYCHTTFIHDFSQKHKSPFVPSV